MAPRDVCRPSVDQSTPLPGTLVTPKSANQITVLIWRHRSDNGPASVRFYASCWQHQILLNNFFFLNSGSPRKKNGLITLSGKQALTIIRDIQIPLGYDCGIVII